MKRGWTQSLFDPYVSFNTKRQGRIDGKLAIPRWDSGQQPEFIRELFHLGQSTVEALAKSWHALDDRLKRACANAELRALQVRRRTGEDLAREEEAEQRYVAVHGHPLSVRKDRLLRLSYWVVVLVVLICEFPLNAVIFQQLGVPYVETLLMTGSVAIALIACAHFLGAQLHDPLGRRPIALASRVLLAVLPCSTILFVALLRRDHMVRLALSRLDGWELLGVNLAINLLIFWALTYYSHLIHDPCTENMLGVLAARRQRRMEMDAAERALAQARISREKAFEGHAREVAAVVAEVRRRAAVYRRAHIRVRPDRDQGGEPEPAWFCSEPSLTIPAHLDRLEWAMDPTSAALGTAPGSYWQ